jgi:glycerophosphoryl diester phosphodiesterase
METVNTPTVDEVNQLNGKDFAMLNEREKVVCEYFLHQGRKFGVSLNVKSEAPQEQLAKANTKEQYNDLISRYPSTIKVTVQ